MRKQQALAILSEFRGLIEQWHLGDKAKTTQIHALIPQVKDIAKRCKVQSVYEVRDARGVWAFDVIERWDTPVYQMATWPHTIKVVAQCEGAIQSGNFNSALKHEVWKWTHPVFLLAASCGFIFTLLKREWTIVLGIACASVMAWIGFHVGAFTGNDPRITVAVCASVLALISGGVYASNKKRNKR